MTERQEKDILEGQETVTLAVAAKALGVTVRTVRRYLETGRLSKIKVGHRTYVSSHDVRLLYLQLKDKDETIGKPGGQEKETEDTITLSLSQYNELLIRVGQLEAENASLNKKLIEDKRPWWRRLLGK